MHGLDLSFREPFNFLYPEVIFLQNIMMNRHSQWKIRTILSSLPTLKETDFHIEKSVGICFMNYGSIRSDDCHHDWKAILLQKH